MKSLPKVCFLPLYRIEYASSRQRVFQFLDPLKGLGFRCGMVQSPQGNFFRRLTYLPPLMYCALSYDVLFIQKRVLPVPLLNVLQRVSSSIVFDFDDAICLNPSLQPRVEAMLRTANVVIAGNRYLASYARRFNNQVTVVPTVVDTHRYLPPPRPRHPKDERVIIGWIGNDPNRGDLEPMQPVFDRLAGRYGSRLILRVIGARPLEMKTDLPLEFVPWSLGRSHRDIQDFDIGIMPLDDTEWSRGKCGFKLIEYMAVETPAVASPVGVNKEIVRDGKTGFLATTNQEWEEKLARLVDDIDLRVQMGYEARKRVESNYSVKAVLPLLDDILKTASNMR